MSDVTGRDPVWRGAFLLGRSPADLVAEFRALPVRPEVMEKWLSGNAARVMDLPPLV